MKRVGVLALVAAVVFAVGGVAFAWQGRMAGMGDPYGLVEDESDLLIHPAKITDVPGKEVRYYSHYRFEYGDISTDRSRVDFDSTTLGQRNLSGDAFDHSALVGATLPLGCGRFGAFFSYRGNRTGVDGGESFGVPASVDVKNELDDFSLRLVYGQAVSSRVKFGAALDISYLREESRSEYFSAVVNPFIDPVSFPFTFFPFDFPRDMKYWEVGGMAGVEAEFGATRVGLTFRGGTNVTGDNTWDSSLGFDLDGDVDVARIGGELWVRHQLSPSLTLPFLLRVDYTDRRREADLDATITSNAAERLTSLEVGGGVDYALSADTKIAAGLYYNFINSRDDLSFVVGGIPGAVFDYGRYPELVEHLVKFTASAEMRLTSPWVVRAGLNVFGGVAEEKYSFDLDLADLRNRTSADGTHWGITGYVGATSRFGPVTFEPFVFAGYQEFQVDDDSAELSAGGASLLLEQEETRRQSLVGVGVSVLF